MSLSVFVELRFWVLVAFSLVLPAGIYGLLLATRSISRVAVLGFGVALVLIAGVDVYLLQSLASLAKTTPSLADDAVFISELSIALYVLPVVFGGIGVNLISHVLLRHLSEAESGFDREHPYGWWAGWRGAPLVRWLDSLDGQRIGRLGYSGV